MAVVGSDTPLIRQWIILRPLCAYRHGLTVNEMEVSEKTFRMDLESLQATDFPSEEAVGPSGRITQRMNHERNPPRTGFRFDKTIAVSASRQVS